MVSVTATPLHHYRAKVATDNTKMNQLVCVPIKLYLHRQAAGWVWLSACSLPAPATKCHQCLKSVLETPTNAVESQNCHSLLNVHYFGASMHSERGD